MPLVTTSSPAEPSSLPRVEGIIVGVDDSEESRGALRWALDEGRIHRSPVVAIHAWRPPLMPPVMDVTPVPAAMPGDLTALIETVREAAQALVERVVREEGGDDPGVDVRPLAVEDEPANALLDAARGADLLVVGSRGLGGFKGLLLGSVSHQVAQHAPCPVVIHRGADG
jgi:nucleotide-binding universal stress UspA family protein